jgi:hypothetical protein
MPNSNINQGPTAVGWPTALQVPFGVAQYLPSQLQSLLFLPFSFSVSFIPIAAGSAPVPQNFTVGNDSHFVLTNVTGSVYGTAVAPPVFFATPPLLLQYTDTGSGFQMQDQAQPWNSLVGSMGNAAGEYLYTVPYLVEANSTVVVTASNIDTSQAYNARMSFSGFKVYGVPRDNPQYPVPTN